VFNIRTWAAAAGLVFSDRHFFLFFVLFFLFFLVRNWFQTAPWGAEHPKGPSETSFEPEQTKITPKPKHAKLKNPDP